MLECCRGFVLWRGPVQTVFGRSSIVCINAGLHLYAGLPYRSAVRFAWSSYVCGADYGQQIASYTAHVLRTMCTFAKFTYTPRSFFFPFFFSTPTTILSLHALIITICRIYYYYYYSWPRTPRRAPPGGELEVRDHSRTTVAFEVVSRRQ